METHAEPAGLGEMQIGVRFEPDWPPEELPSFARWVEQAGYDELWLCEDLPWAGGFAMAATALASTTTLRVGLGVLPAVTRNVATTAMEIAALTRIAPGRLIVGMGYGLREWMEQIGARTSRRITCLDETVTALKGLLAGDELKFTGQHVQLDHVRLGRPPGEVPPILLGTSGPKGLGMAARVSDGLVLAEVCVPAAVRWAREQMSATGSAGRTVVYTLVSVNDDPDRALAQTRAKMHRVVDMQQAFPHLMEIAGLGAHVSGEIPAATLRSMAATGTPADCAKTVADLAAAGASTVVLIAGDEQPLQSYERFANEVMPLLRQSEVSTVG